MRTVEQVEKDTIVVDRREGLWRLRIYPDQIQLFQSRERAEAEAQEIACSKVPAWTVVVHEPDD